MGRAANRPKARVFVQNMLNKALQRRGFDRDQDTWPRSCSSKGSIPDASMGGHDGTIERGSLRVDWVFALAVEGENT